MRIHFRRIDSPRGPLTMATADHGRLALEFPRNGWHEGDPPLLRWTQA